MNILKNCSKCKKDKPLIDFCKQKGRAHGVSSQCKECKKEYREKNKENINTRRKESRDKNKGSKALSDKIYYEKNKERIKAKSMSRYKENKEEINKRAKTIRDGRSVDRKALDAEYHKRYSETYSKEKRRKSKQDWKSKNRDKVIEQASKRRCSKSRAIPFDLSKKEMIEIGAIYKECDKKELKHHVDHIIAIRGVLPDGKRVLGAHRPSNLQILTEAENLKKANLVTYEDLEKAREGFDYIHVPIDYHEDPHKYPNIGLDIKRREK